MEEMKITVLNGDMNQDNRSFSNYLDRLTEKLREDHSVDVYPLHQMDLHYCLGCWSCWWKTPGRCAIKDDADNIFTSVINSDFIIFASPLMAGFTSLALKKITDRLIVLLHPYIQMINGESHHKKRYDKYPAFGLLVEKETDTDDEDLKIISDIYDRFAINFHSRKKYMKIIHHDNIEEIAHETCTI